MNQSDQFKTPIRGFTITGFFWALIASFAGLLTQTQIFMGWPASDSLLTYGYLRPIFTSSLIFGAGLSFFFGVSYYMLKKEEGSEMKLEWLAMAGLLLQQLGLAIGIMSILAGGNKGREFGEFSWLADNLIAISLIVYLIAASSMLKSVREISRGVVFSIIGAAGALGIFLLGNIGQPFSPIESVPLFTGNQDMAVQEFYRAGVYGFFILFPLFSALYYMVPAHSKTALNSGSTANFQAMAMIVLIPLSGAAALAYTHVPALSVTIGLIASIALTIAVLGGVMNLQATASDASRKDSISSFFTFGLVFIILFAVLRTVYYIPMVQRLVGFTWFNMNDLGVDMLTYGLLIFSGAGYIIMQTENNRAANGGLMNLQLWILAAGVVLILIGNISGGFMQGASMSALNEEGALLYSDWTAVLYGAADVEKAAEGAEAASLTSRAIFSLHGLTLIGYLAVFVGMAIGFYNILLTQKEEGPAYESAA